MGVWSARSDELLGMPGFLTKGSARYKTTVPLFTHPSYNIYRYMPSPCLELIYARPIERGQIEISVWKGLLGLLQTQPWKIRLAHDI